jgi:hypothetical protein
VKFNIYKIKSRMNLYVASELSRDEVEETLKQKGDFVDYIHRSPVISFVDGVVTIKLSNTRYLVPDGVNIDHLRFYAKNHELNLYEVEEIDLGKKEEPQERFLRLVHEGFRADVF